jgi:hypothetical protein
VGEPVIGLVPVGTVQDGDLLPRVLDGDAFSVPLVADQVVTVEANNDERAGDLYVMIFDGDDDLVAGPGVADFRFEYLNADWGCGTEPANQPPDRPRGCPDNTYVVDSSGVHTIVLAAHDGLEASVGYSMTVESEGVLLRLETTTVP